MKRHQGIYFDLDPISGTDVGTRTAYVSIDLTRKGEWFLLLEVENLVEPGSYVPVGTFGPFQTPAQIQSVWDVIRNDPGRYFAG